MDFPRLFLGSTITVRALSVNYAGLIDIQYEESFPTGLEPPRNFMVLPWASYQIPYRDEAAIPDEFISFINQLRNLWDLYDDLFPSV